MTGSTPCCAGRRAQSIAPPTRAATRAEVLTRLFPAEAEPTTTTAGESDAGRGVVEPLLPLERAWDAGGTVFRPIDLNNL